MKAFFKKVLTTVLGFFVGTILSFIFLPLLFVLLIHTIQGGGEGVSKHSILHLRLRGHVVDHNRPFDFESFSPRSLMLDEERPIGLFELIRALHRAKIDPRIDGVFLDFKNLDIGWAAATSLHDAVRDFNQSGKFAYAYADHYSEKTLYLATAAEKIFAEPNGDVEFNGLSVSSAFLKGLMAKLEVEPRIFRVGKFKSAVEPFLLDQMSTENRAQEQALIDDIWGVVTPEWTRVSGKPPAELNRIVSELQIESADSAKNAGLIHQLAFRDEVEDLMKEKSVGDEDDLRLVTPLHYLRDSGGPKPVQHKGKKVAVLFAEGEISSGIAATDGIGSDSFVRDFEEIKKDEDVRAVVVRVNSPGGDALASDVIWREIAACDEELPVVVSMGDVAASGGYYMSAGARYIFAEPTTITGSIGVFGLMFGSGKFFQDKLGVKFDRVVTHPYSDIGNPNRPMDEIEKKTIQGSVERVYGRFLEVVSNSRPFDTKKDVDKIAQGRVWSGVRAKEIGLVDELGGLDRAIKKAAEFAQLGDQFDLEVYPHATDTLSELMERFFDDSVEAKINSGVGALLTGARLGWLVNQTTQLVLMPKPGVYARLPFDLKIE